MRQGARDRALLDLERGGSGRRSAAGSGSSGARAAGSVQEREGAAAEELCSGELVLATMNGGDEARWRSTGFGQVFEKEGGFRIGEDPDEEETRRVAVAEWEGWDRIPRS